jgi:hypothetical protein
MARTRTTTPAPTPEPAAPAGRRSRAKAADAPAPTPEPTGRRARNAAPATPAATTTSSRRSRNGAAAEPAAPAKGKREAINPRRKLAVPGRNRRTPADDNNDAVRMLVQAALNANPQLEVVTSGQLNLLLMGSGLASSSADASVLWQKAVTAGAVVEA